MSPQQKGGRAQRKQPCVWDSLRPRLRPGLKLSSSPAPKQQCLPLRQTEHYAHIFFLNPEGIPALLPSPFLTCSDSNGIRHKKHFLSRQTQRGGNGANSISCLMPPVVLHLASAHWHVSSPPLDKPQIRQHSPIVVQGLFLIDDAEPGSLPPSPPLVDRERQGRSDQ